MINAVERFARSIDLVISTPKAKVIASPPDLNYHLLVSGKTTKKQLGLLRDFANDRVALRNFIMDGAT